MPTTKFIGKDQMEELLEMAHKKGYFIGITLLPMRDADQLKEDKDKADLVVVVADDRPILEHAVCSDVVTIDLQTSCEFLIAELKNLPSNR